MKMYCWRTGAFNVEAFVMAASQEEAEAALMADADRLDLEDIEYAKEKGFHPFPPHNCLTARDMINLENGYSLIVCEAGKVQWASVE